MRAGWCRVSCHRLATDRTVVLVVCAVRSRCSCLLFWRSTCHRQRGECSFIYIYIYTYIYIRTYIYIYVHRVCLYINNAIKSPFWLKCKAFAPVLGTPRDTWGFGPPGLRTVNCLELVPLFIRSAASTPLWPRGGPKETPGDPRGTPGGPKRGQREPNRIQGRPKGRPRGPKEDQRGSQGGPRGAQGGPGEPTAGL